MHVQNYGASATVDIYVNGSLALTYTGDVTVAGMTNFDQVGLEGWGPYNWSLNSEIIAADEDTRTFSLVTMPLNGAGTVDQWTGVYSDINQVTLSDASPNYTNVVDQDQQYNVGAIPPGNFSVKAMKISARVSRTSDSTPTKIALEYKNGSTTVAGSDKSVTNSWDTIESLDAVDPTTSAPWLPNDLTNLQIGVRSRS
jgi:hypothetical protein